MPIRADLRHLYGAQWQAVRQRILERAMNRCEQCGKRNHRRVWVVSGLDMRAIGRINSHDQFWSGVKGDGQRWRSCTLSGAVVRPCTLSGAVVRLKLRGRQWAHAREVRVVLTIAHLNHTAGDDREENLKALCQWCHLHYDALQHKMSRAGRKDRSRPLLAVDV